MLLGEHVAEGRCDAVCVTRAGVAHPRRGPRGREAFHVGRFCCARLVLYHTLVHWRHRLLARLTRELKSERRRRKV